MHDRRRIRAERAAGGSIRGLARDLGASRNAVRRAIAPGARLDYRRPSLADDFEPAVRDVLADDPHVPLSRIADLIEWPASRRALSELVARLRPLALERETDGLIRPAMGAVRVGPLAVGSVKVGIVHGAEGSDRAA